jgi:hypothetical protein
MDDVARGILGLLILAFAMVVLFMVRVFGGHSDSRESMKRSLYRYQHIQHISQEPPVFSSDFF